MGGEEAGLSALFAGLNPERITVAAYSNGLARYALRKGVDYARDRTVWDAPIGSHQAIAHPLAKAHVEVELARMATTRAAWLYDTGDHAAAGEAANIAKYAAAEPPSTPWTPPSRPTAGTGCRSSTASAP